jgi:type I restriction enzyme S subunit
MSPAICYSEYKPSGAAWLGDVPAHWGMKPLWAMYRSKKCTGHPQETLLSVYRDHGVIDKSSRTDNKNRASEDLSGYQLVVKGDLVTNKMKAWQGSIAISGLQGIVSPAYYVFDKLHSGNDTYFHHLFRSAPYIAGYQSISKGIRVGQWDLEADKFRLFPVLIPPRPEQDNIVAYLDRTTARIDSLVSKKTRFIELLRERRQSLITQAVTKGLDPDAPTKESGTAWLGNVPRHWGVFRFKQSTIFCQNGLWGTDPNGIDDIECVRVADFNRPSLSVNPDIPTLRAITKKERLGRLLRRGNLLLEKSGGGESQPVGQVVIYDRDSEAVCSNFVAKVELARGMDPRFWNYQHHAAYVARVNVKSIKQTSGIQNLDQHQYLSELAAYPSTEEQLAIADYLDRVTSRIDTLIAKTELSIELLREHRTALITAAVTGKIDLRSAA